MRRLQFSLAVLGSIFCFGALSAQDSGALEQVMAHRYAPYADWSEQVTLPPQVELPSRYWKTVQEIRDARAGVALPLSGLKLALDPGHIGGVWAEFEKRNFRVADTDDWVREGELVLAVAQRVQTKLQALGAEVVLLRESADPVNPRRPVDYVAAVMRDMGAPKSHSWSALVDYMAAVRNQAVHRSIVVGDLAERARLVNEVIQPDAVISFHINAAPWPASEGGKLALVDRNDLHVLIFGCMSDDELASPGQRRQFAIKLENGSGPEEILLGRAMAQALKHATGLPSAKYERKNAIVDPENPYLWFRNLMLLRSVECPVVLLEPYVANSKETYLRIQAALRARAEGRRLPEDDILVEYADAVVEGVRRAYRSPAVGEDR